MSYRIEACFRDTVLIGHDGKTVFLEPQEQDEIVKLRMTKGVKHAMLIGGPRHGEVIPLPRDDKDRQLPTIQLHPGIRSVTSPWVPLEGTNLPAFRVADLPKPIHYNYMNGPVVRGPAGDYAYIYQAEELEKANVTKRAEELESSIARHEREVHTHLEALKRAQKEREGIYVEHAV